MPLELPSKAGSAQQWLELALKSKPEAERDRLLLLDIAVTLREILAKLDQPTGVIKD